MNLSRVLFIAIFFLSSTTLLTVSSALEAVKDSIGLPRGLEERIKFDQKQKDLEQQYKENLLKVLNSFTLNKANLTDQEAENLESQLLSLTVPRDFTDLHFKLVTSLTAIDKNSNNGEKETARQKLEGLIKNYSWLTSTLSLFIVHNF